MNAIISRHAALTTWVYSVLDADEPYIMFMIDDRADDNTSATII